MRSILAAVMAAFFYLLTFAAHAQGLYIKIDTPAEPNTLAELQKHIPILRGISVEKVRINKINSITLARIEDRKYCLRNHCINIIALRHGNELTHVAANATDRIFIIDEPAGLAGRSGLVLTLLTEASTVVIKLFVSDDSIIVMP